VVENLLVEADYEDLGQMWIISDENFLYMVNRALQGEATPGERRLLWASTHRWRAVLTEKLAGTQAHQEQLRNEYNGVADFVNGANKAWAWQQWPQFHDKWKKKLYKTGRTIQAIEEMLEQLQGGEHDE
jgi:hypothetical protein